MIKFSVIWTDEAVEDRDQILTFIANANPIAAIDMDALFGRAAARLSEYPMMGKTGTIPGTRELIPHNSYRLIYEIEGETVWILALTHTARQWPT